MVAPTLAEPLLAPAPAADPPLPVLPALQSLLPGLRRGQVVEVDSVGALAIALLAGASKAGSWCAVVGWPSFGGLAASGMGCCLDRLLLVDDPGERWSDVVVTLLDAVDVVLVRPPVRPPSGLVRRIMAVARKSGSSLIAAGSWEGAATRLRVESALCTGVEQGHGHLRGRRVKVVAERRGRPESAWLWLPGPSGEVASAELTAVNEMNRPQAVS